MKAGATSGTPVVPETPIDPTRPLSPDELARWLNVPPAALKKVLRQGLRDVGIRLDKEWRFRAEEVWEWLKAREASDQEERRRLKEIIEAAIPPHLRRQARPAAGGPKPRAKRGVRQPMTSRKIRAERRMSQ